MSSEEETMRREERHAMASSLSDCTAPIAASPEVGGRSATSRLLPRSATMPTFSTSPKFKLDREKRLMAKRIIFPAKTHDDPNSPLIASKNPSDILPLPSFVEPFIVGEYAARGTSAEVQLLDSFAGQPVGALTSPVEPEDVKSKELQMISPSRGGLPASFRKKKRSTANPTQST